VEAFDQLAASLPLDLVLAGRKGWKTGPILEAVRQARHADRIHLPGFVPNEDLAAVLSAAEVFVYPSLYEGFGIPLADALACGVPAVTGNTTSLPEVAGDAALTVDASDPAALAEAMRRAVVDTDLRARLAARGPEQVARFTWDTTAAATLATYRRLGAGDLAGA
jgi:glycosyltransferase involved in cell wall biosynthesis